MKAARARASPPRHMTLAAWAALDEEVRGELVEGVLEQEEVPTAVHEFIVSWLNAVLFVWARHRGAVVFNSEAKYAIGRKTGRKPDLSMLLKGNFPPGCTGLTLRLGDMWQTVAELEAKR